MAYSRKSESRSSTPFLTSLIRVSSMVPVLSNSFLLFSFSLFSSYVKKMLLIYPLPPPPFVFRWLLPHLLSLLQYSKSVIWALLNGSSCLFAFGAKKGFLCICRVFRCGVCAGGIWVLRNFARVLERYLVREVAICAFEVSMRNVWMVEAVLGFALYRLGEAVLAMNMNDVE